MPTTGPLRLVSCNIGHLHIAGGWFIVIMQRIFELNVIGNHVFSTAPIKLCQSPWKIYIVPRRTPEVAGVHILMKLHALFMHYYTLNFVDRKRFNPSAEYFKCLLWDIVSNAFMNLSSIITCFNLVVIFKIWQLHLPIPNQFSYDTLR